MSHKNLLFSENKHVCQHLCLWTGHGQPLWFIIHGKLSARDSKVWQIPYDKGINCNQLLSWRLSTHLLQMYLLGQHTEHVTSSSSAKRVLSMQNSEDKEIKKKQLVDCMVCFISVKDHKSNRLPSHKHFLQSKAKTNLAMHWISFQSFITENCCCYLRGPLLCFSVGCRSELSWVRNLTEILLKTNNRSFQALWVKTLWNRSISLWNNRQTNCLGAGP